MQMLLRKIKQFLLKLFALIVLSLAAIILLTLAYKPEWNKAGLNDLQLTLPFSLNKKDIIFKSEGSSVQTNAAANNTQSFSSEVIKRAEAMVNVKWTPSYNLICEKASYTFIKGRTFYGIPYSMDFYQVTSTEDFLSKINNSKVIYGNDCSGFVSAAWGISRQTTYTLYNAMINNIKIDGKAIQQISWNDLKTGDALLLNKGSGDGHIMLYISCDDKNSDTLTVYEQNIPTAIPYEPIPAARKDVRSKSKLIGQGYIPIRLV
ncbi:MAG: C40 family peptidase [Bacillota bacterium]|nr:C40 family peptidase [Bacillota bacterium]